MDCTRIYLLNHQRLKYSFTIEGQPKPKQRPRFWKGHAVTPQATRDAEAQIAWFAKSEGVTPIEGAITLEVSFFLQKPKKKKDIFHVGRPDLDNLVKLVSDALNGIAWRDDSQVWRIVADKTYSDSPRTYIQIYNGY